MGKYNRAVITDQGEALRARAIAGEATMQFAHAKTSSYIYPDGTDLTKLTELQEVKQTVIPSNVQISNETLISVRTLFGNEKISEEYLIQNVGIYASDGEKEILFAVCQAIIPDQMLVYDGVAPSSFIYNVQLTVSQATDISLVISGAGTATTEDILDLEKSVEEVDKKKIDASGGDISDTVITSAEEPTAEYPVPAAGDSTKVFLGKTRKFFSDIKNWMTGVCMLGQIVNNCVTDNAKLPLSAAQGKQLMDLYNVLNTNQQKLITNLGNCKIITGSTGLITFEIWERKDIKVELGYPVAYFNFSFSGNGFEFETSADISADGKGAYIIAHNCGSRNANGTIDHMKCNTTIHWIALVTT